MDNRIDPHALALPIEPGAPVALLPLCADRKVVGATLVDYDVYEWAVEFRWHLDHRGYATRGIWDPRRKVTALSRLHREILGLERGSKMESDHIDGNTLNNLRQNLRAVTHAQNMQNRREHGNRGSSSRYRGVSWDRRDGRWRAQAMVDGKQRMVGRFDSEEEAAAAAAKFREEHMTHTVN